MSSVNKVILVGNLGKDPELKTLESGKKLVNFSLATSEKFKETTVTEWHNVTMWEKAAEIAEKYLKKGSKIYLEGRIKYESYDDKDGVKKYTTKIIGDSFKMLDSKPSTGGETTPASKAETSAENYMKKNPTSEEARNTKPAEKETVSEVQGNWNDDDLPF